MPTFALAFVRAPVCRGWGASVELCCTPQQLRPLTLYLHPSGGCPHPRRPGHLDPMQTPNQSLPMTLRTTDQRALSSPKRPNGHHTVEPNSHPSAHPRAPQRQVATASSTGSRWSQGLWQFRPWPLSSQNPWVVLERTLTQASARRCQAGPSGVGVWALACADRAWSC